MACGGLRMHWCHSGGKANSSEEKQQQSSGLGWIRSFSKQELASNKLLFIDPKSQQKQKSQAHCSSLRLVNRRRNRHHHLQDEINRVNTTPNSSDFNSLIRSDHTSHHCRKMSNVHQNTRILEDEEDQISQKLDHWIRDCLAEIVSNIGEAPLLAHIYDDGDEEEEVSSSSIKIMIEKAVDRGRWEAERPTATPNGVILVEELNGSSKEGVATRNENKSNGVGSSTSSNQHHKVWGLLIQGKGVNRIGHACYILKTCRVQSLFGFCTHFCLTRVDCFVDSAEIQLQKMWLHR